MITKLQPNRTKDIGDMGGARDVQIWHLTFILQYTFMQLIVCIYSVVGYSVYLSIEILVYRKVPSFLVCALEISHPNISGIRQPREMKFGVYQRIL